MSKRPYKYCPRCGEYKLTTHFGGNKSRPDGLQGWCRQCRHEASQKQKRKRKTLDAQSSHPRPMTGEQFTQFYQENGWLYRYIGSAAAMKTRDYELRADLRQEAWIRLSFCKGGLTDEAYKRIADLAIDQAYTKAWRARQYELDTIESMTRDEYNMWMTGIYLP